MDLNIESAAVVRNKSLKIYLNTVDDKYVIVALYA